MVLEKVINWVAKFPSVGKVINYRQITQGAHPGSYREPLMESLYHKYNTTYEILRLNMEESALVLVETTY